MPLRQVRGDQLQAYKGGVQHKPEENEAAERINSSPFPEPKPPNQKPPPSNPTGTDFVPPPKLPPMNISPSTAQSMFTVRLHHLLCLLRNFPSSPFTIQRLSEILIAPPGSYRHTNKFCNAVERCLTVTGTVEWVKDREGIKKREFVTQTVPSSNLPTTTQPSSSSSSSVPSSTTNGVEDVVNLDVKKSTNDDNPNATPETDIVGSPPLPMPASNDNPSDSILSQTSSSTMPGTSSPTSSSPPTHPRSPPDPHPDTPPPLPDHSVTVPVAKKPKLSLTSSSSATTSSSLDDNNQPTWNENDTGGYGSLSDHYARSSPPLTSLSDSAGTASIAVSNITPLPNNFISRTRPGSPGPDEPVISVGSGNASGSDSDSDSSSGSNYEPLTAVRVMALNRLQQNRRREGYESEGSKDSTRGIIDSEGSESDRESVDSLSEGSKDSTRGIIDSEGSESDRESVDSLSEGSKDSTR
eukprot:CAMPEP_0118644692 /NCGR_PEP_ID=MMETSP0785-20121206/7084_1 /TAXON_ID=91992 /ORGANISM="Bolidomonas pacifica, Strain CCMP 1866" /LENGTH=467 /DNA_ID=CAMNT_0006536487 /DNA_START=53 /DNA_END=1452 /DNA_ORIENTATION=-